MADFRRIGRNNKNRGRAFERYVAEFLGWTRVPYSGAVKDWGGGDVVDGFYSKDGLWTAECKTQQERPDKGILVEKKWIGQMLAAGASGRKPILVIRVVGTTKPFVIMEADVHNWLVEQVNPTIVAITHFNITTRGKGFNFPISREALHATNNAIVELRITHDGEEHRWYVWTLKGFKATIDASGLHRPDKQPEV